MTNYFLHLSSGTGTLRGDPTEVNALGEFFSMFRNVALGPLLVGSVKSNIGHTESAAATAGLIKVLLMMNHGLYVPSLHIKADKSNLNPKIKLAEFCLDIPTSVTEWPRNKNGKRIACLNSFGFGGSNSHAIIAQRSSRSTKIAKHEMENHAPLIRISGVDKESLRLNLLQFHDDLDGFTSSIADIAYTSFNHRDAFPYRTLLYGRTVLDLQNECKNRLQRIDDISPKKNTKKIFVYCGVGTTWTGMCSEFMSLSNIFRETIRRLDEYLEPLAGWKIGDKFISNLSFDDSFLNHIAIFSCQVALTEVWRSFGIIPDAVVGQSVGEVAAAYAANFLTLEEAVKVIYVRSKILAKQAEGSMAVIGNLHTKEVENVCKKYGRDVCIAVYSSPSACTISGRESAVKLVAETLQADSKSSDVFIKQLKVKCAYHSPLLDCCVDEMKTKIDGCFVKTNSELESLQTVPLLSTATGKYAVLEQMKSGLYWAKNVREPVLFMQAIKQVYDPQSYNVYFELGPRPVLKAHMLNILEQDSNARTIPSMVIGKEIPCLYQSVSESFELGIDVNRTSLFPSMTGMMTSIPRYKFNRTGELFIPSSAKDYLAGFTKANDAGHMFIRCSRTSHGETFMIYIDDISTPFVYDHFLFGQVIIPGATYVETGFHVGKELLRMPVDKLTVELNFMKTFKPLVGHKHKLNVQTATKRLEHVNFSIKSNDYVLAEGIVSKRKRRRRENFDLKYLKSQCPIYVPKAECYRRLENLNFQYGESLSLIQGAWTSCSKSKCLSEIKLSKNILEANKGIHFHPAVIDSLFQMFGILVKEMGNGNLRKVVVPKGVESVALNTSFDTMMYGYAEEVNVTKTGTFYNAVLLSETGAVIAEIENFYTKFVSEYQDIDKSVEYALSWSKISDISDVEEMVHSHVIFYSNTKESETLHQMQKIADIAIYTDLDTIIQENSLSNDTAIIFHTSGFMDTSIADDGKFILNCAVKRFLDVKRFLMFIKDLSSKPSITFVTENTQLCPGRVSVNINGSELWGMLRSVVHEGYYNDIKLIDIDKNNFDARLLSKLLFCSSSIGTEFAITGSNVFSATIQHCTRMEPFKRLISGVGIKKKALFSSSLKEVSEPYLILPVGSEDVLDADEVSLESCTLHDSSLYLTTTEGGATGFNLQTEAEGGQIIVVEGRGKLTRTGDDIIFLYPVNAYTVVSVPGEFQLRRSDYPEYSSGILMLMNILYHMVFRITKGTSVIVLKESDEIDVGQKVLTRLLSRKQCTAQFCTIDELSQKAFPDVSVLLITSTLWKNDWKIAFNSLGRAVTVVVLDMHILENVKKWINYNFTGKRLTILSSCEIFSPKEIQKAMNCIKDCLRHLNMSSVDFANNKCVLQLPMPELQIWKGIEEKTVNCFCTKDTMFRRNASYVVVGGLTGLGWEILTLMVQMGAGLIISLSRRKPSDEMQMKIEELQNRFSCKVLHMQVDISELGNVQRVFTEIQNKFSEHPIRGIFHGAGITKDSVLDTVDERSVFDVLKPKILGAWNLHIASLNFQIDFFILHSSVVSVIGNPSQTNYSAANSFLDSFALYRRYKGLPAQSINWGALSIGMAVENDVVKSKLSRNGFGFLEKELIRECLMKLLVNDATNVVFADIEWKKLMLIPSFAMQSNKYMEVQRFRTVNLQDSRVKSIDLVSLMEMDYTEKTAIVKSTVRDKLNEVLVIHDDSWTDETLLLELGMDSMAATNLSFAIHDIFKYRLSIVMLLSEETTLSTVAETVVQNLGQTLEITKELSIESYSPEVQTLFNSKELTYMQKDFITNYVQDRNDPYCLRIIDIEMFNIRLHIDEWKLILKHVFAIRPELRRKYIFTETGEMLIEHISEDDIELNLEMILATDFVNSQESDVRLEYNPDISNSLPYYFKIADSDNNTLLRIVTHALVTDLKGISLLCMDMEKTLFAYLAKQKLPDSYPNTDTALIVKESVLPRIAELENFWDTYTNHDIKPITLAETIQSVDVKFCCQSRVYIPSLTVAAIKKYVASQNISVYEFFMSLYQLYLYIGSGNPIVPVGTAADMRFHMPELRNVISRCVNYLPVIAHVDQLKTLTEFIQSNSLQILNTTMNCAYPSSLILKKIRSAGAREDIFRHFLIMNDMTSLNEISKDQVRAEVKRVLYERPDRETFIYICHNLVKDEIKLEVGINSKLCGQYGQSLSDILLWLANHAMTNGNTTIKLLQDFLKTNGPTYSGTVGETKTITKALNAPSHCQEHNVKNVGRRKKHEVSIGDRSKYKLIIFFVSHKMTVSKSIQMHRSFTTRNTSLKNTKYKKKVKWNCKHFGKMYAGCIAKTAIEFVCQATFHYKVLICFAKGRIQCN